MAITGFTIARSATQQTDAATNQSPEPSGEQINFFFAGRPVKDSSDCGGSDTDSREGSLPDDSRPRRSAANSIRSRAMHQSAGIELPINSSPVQSRRRYRFTHRDKRRTERSFSLDRSVVSPEEDDDESSLIRNDEEASKEGANGVESPSRLPHHRIAAWARELMDDLQSIEDEDRPAKESVVDDLGDSLAIKRLKNNIVRFGRISSAISSSFDSIQSLLQWQSPTASILFILVSSYAIWHGLFLALVTAAILWKLTMNYLQTNGWARHWAANGDGIDIEEPPVEKTSSSVTERLAVVLQVARKVQNQLGAVCDAAEKIRNLLMWRHEASRRLYLIVWLLMPATLLVPASQLLTCLGFYMLFKLMVVDYVFLKFPRLRAKYDTSSVIWQSLPTDADLDARHKAEQGLRNAAASSANAEPRTFWEAFNLAPNEHPLSGWHNGIRCTLVNRDKSLTSSFKSGRLFLTANYLCFERSKTHPGKNVVIPLDRIVRLEKGNQYSWIPGGGMIIEVFVQGLDRAYTFGAILSRDDVFNTIRDAAEKVGCVWCEDKTTAASST